MRFPTSVLEPFRSLWCHRDLVVQMVNREVRMRYRGSTAGVAWIAITPLLMLVVYTFFLTEVFPTRWASASGSYGEIALILYTGLLLHAFLSEVMSRAPTLIVDNANLVKKVVFPLDLLPWITTLTAIFHLAVGFAVWLLFHFLQRGLPPATALWLPVVMLPLVLCTLGIAWMLASLGVYLRDISQAIPVVMSILLFGSAIFYPVSTLREPFRTLVLFSPLTIPVEQARRAIFERSPPDGPQMLAYTVVALAVWYIGFVWFQSTRKGFADVV